MTIPPDIQRRVLHAIRLLGYANTTEVSERAGLSAATCQDVVLYAQANGHVSWSQFADDGGWSLTEAGKSWGEDLLKQELDRLNARTEVECVMMTFNPLNQVVTEACTRWQLAEMGIAESATTLTETLTALFHAADQWAVLQERLVRALPRFQGYHERFRIALENAQADPSWVTSIDRDSAHRVWFELHEDLLATLGHAR